MRIKLLVPIALIMIVGRVYAMEEEIALQEGIDRIAFVQKLQSKYPTVFKTLNLSQIEEDKANAILDEMMVDPRFISTIQQPKPPKVWADDESVQSLQDKVAWVHEKYKAAVLALEAITGVDIREQTDRLLLAGAQIVDRATDKCCAPKPRKKKDSEAKQGKRLFKGKRFNADKGGD